MSEIMLVKHWEFLEFLMSLRCHHVNLCSVKILTLAIMCINSVIRMVMMNTNVRR